MQRALIQDAGPAPGIGWTDGAGGIPDALIAPVTKTGGRAGALDRGDGVLGAREDDVASRAHEAFRTLRTRPAVGTVESWETTAIHQV